MADDEVKVVRVSTGMAEGSGRRPFYDVTVFPRTGNVRFRLDDGTMYDYESSDLGFGETDPVRRAHAMEAIEVTTMVMQEHPELFVGSVDAGMETIPDDGNMMVIARLRGASGK